MSEAAPIQDDAVRRINAETDKLIAERQKLAAEAGKLAAEQFKLYVEGQKLGGDRMLAPIIAIGSLFVGAMGLIVGLLATLSHH